MTHMGIKASARRRGPRQLVTEDSAFGGVPNTTFTTAATIAPAANALVLAAVTNLRSAADVAAPTLSGGGMTTWTSVGSDYFRDDGIAAQLTLFHSQQATPGSGALTVTCADACLQYALNVAQFAGVVVGSNGADAIVQAVFGADLGNLGTSFSITLGALDDPANVTAGFIAQFGEQILVPDSGWAPIGTQLDAEAPSQQMLNIYSSAGDLNPGATWSLTEFIPGIWGVELAKA